MIIFHEGMPRQGKSYAALVDHIVPAIQKRRKVYARIDGLNHPQIAEVAGISEDDCRTLLIELTEEEVHHLAEYAFDKDALIVIDELQNYWPQQRRPLDDDLRKWIAEHGHHGWDVLTMGQVLSECHKTWVNRTNRKVQFQKKDVVGKPNEYQWTMFLGKPDKNGVVKFVQVSKGSGEYDPKYFGCYASHSQGTDNTDTYEDDRINIWKTPLFRKGIPALGVFVLLAIGYLIYVFNSGSVGIDAEKVTSKAKPTKTAITETITEEGPDGKLRTITKTAQAEPVKESKPVKQDEFAVPDFIAEMSAENKIRLAYMIRSAKGTRIGIEWRDGSKRVVDALDLADIEALGWRVLFSATDKMVVLVKGEKRFIATSWPIEETLGRITKQQEDEIKAPSIREEQRVALAN